LKREGTSRRRRRCGIRHLDGWCLRLADYVGDGAQPGRPAAGGANVGYARCSISRPTSRRRALRRGCLGVPVRDVICQTRTPAAQEPGADATADSDAGRPRASRSRCHSFPPSSLFETAAISSDNL
jgi:hypothetical protein